MTAIVFAIFKKNTLSTFICIRCVMKIERLSFKGATGHVGEARLKIKKILTNNFEMQASRMKLLYSYHAVKLIH